MNVKLSGSQKFKVTTLTGGIQVPVRFKDLSDFNGQNLSDKSVIMYDAETQKYTTVNVDELLSAAVDGELPSDFKDQLDTDLDNRIDLDGGAF